MSSYNNSSDRKNAPLSIVRGINPKIITVSTMGDVLEDIPKQERAKAGQMVTAYKSDPPQYKKLKDGLHGFIVGAFTKRDADSCTKYVPCVVLDIDKIVSHDYAKQVFEDVSKLDYTFACFLSPSGHGLRILVWSDHIEQRDHERAYEQITAYYCQKTGLRTDVDIRASQNNKVVNTIHFDTSAKAFPRFWYYSYNDEFLYVNEDSKTFQLHKAEAETPPAPPTATVQKPKQKTDGVTSSHPVSKLVLTDAIIIEVVEEMLKTRSIPAGRNNYVFHFAALAKEHGLSDDVIADYCLSQEEADFKADEIAATVKSAVERTEKKFEPIQVLAYYKKLKGIETQPKTSKSVNKATTQVGANGQIEINLPGSVVFKRLEYRATGV